MKTSLALVLLVGGIVAGFSMPSQAPPAEPVAVADLVQQQPKLLPPDPPKLEEEEPERRDPTVPSEELRRLLNSAKRGGYPPAVDWIDERSKLFVRKVLRREFKPQAIDVRQWSPEGLEEFIAAFEAKFEGEPSADFWGYDYLSLHQETLKRRAKQAGIYYDFGDTMKPEDFLLGESLYYKLAQVRISGENEKKRREFLEEIRAKTSPFQIGPGAATPPMPKPDNEK